MENTSTTTFLAQPPRIAGLTTTFQSPTNTDSIIQRIEKGGDTESLIKAMDNLSKVITKYSAEHNALVKQTDSKVDKIQSSVANLEKVLTKEIEIRRKEKTEDKKTQDKFEEKILRTLGHSSSSGYKYGRRYRTRDEEGSNIGKSFAKFMSKSSGTLVTGVLDTLFPYLNKTGINKQLGKLTSNGVGLIGTLFGVNAHKKYTRQYQQSPINQFFSNNSKTKAYMKPSAPLGQKLQGGISRVADISKSLGSKALSGLKGVGNSASNLAKTLFGGKKTIGVDVLDSMGNVVGKTSASYKTEGMLGKLFGKKLGTDLFKQVSKAFVKDGSKAVTKSVGTAMTRVSTGVTRSLATTVGRSIATGLGGVARGAMTLAPMTVGAIANPYVLGGAALLGGSIWGINALKDRGYLGGRPNEGIKANRDLTPEQIQIGKQYTKQLPKGTPVKVHTKLAQGNSEAVKVWNFLASKGLKPEAISGVMGNLQAESGLESVRLQGDMNKTRAKSIDYTSRVDSGAISRDQFIKDTTGGGGYGLAQWTSYNRKAGLYDYAKARGKSIGDMDTQLEYMWKELVASGLDKKLRNAESVRQASNIMLHQFERPADQSTGVQNTRTAMSEKWLKDIGTTAKPITITTKDGTVIQTSKAPETLWDKTKNLFNSGVQKVNSVFQNGKEAVATTVNDVNSSYINAEDHKDSIMENFKQMASGMEELKLQIQGQQNSLTKQFGTKQLLERQHPEPMTTFTPDGMVHAQGVDMNMLEFMQSFMQF